MKLSNVILAPGDRASQPAATTVPEGTLYCVTDENNRQERSTGTVWEAYTPESLPLFDAGNSAGALALDWVNGDRQLFTLTGNAALTLNNPANGVTYTIVIKTGAGAFNPTWPAAVHWPAGVTPTVTVTAAKVDLVTLFYVASTGVYYASIQQNYAV